jgi:predicted nucleic acid-binding protein
MGALIDASIWIAAERGKLDLERMLKDNGEDSVAISALTASELLHGVHRAANAAQRGRREAFVERILASVPVVPFDLVAARVHALIWSQLTSKGVNVGAHDLLISANALALGYGIATRDQRSFPKIPGLRVLLW